MNTIAVPAARTIRATFAREFLSYRINRFIYLHAGLMAAIGALALIAPPEAASPGTAWWVLNGVIYVASLSSLLLGLSSAQAEAEEFPLLFTQPLRTGCWVAGKGTGLVSVVVPAAALLVLPTLIVAGGSWLLLGAAVAAAAVSVLWAWTGLALGFWIQDPVRGLIAALAVWCLLLFGVDLLLILIGGSEWIHENPAVWVGALMLSPLDAYRVTLLFVVERAAFSGAELHPLTRWWLDHAAAWLALCLAGWCAVVAWAAILGAARRRTRC
jgi:ABC-2 type transport system permease protein/Cu-processing system permease protein